MFKVLRAAVMVLSSEVSPLFSRFEPVPLSLATALPHNKSPGMRTAFSNFRMSLGRSSDACSMHKSDLCFSRPLLFVSLVGDEGKRRQTEREVEDLKG